MKLLSSLIKPRTVKRIDSLGRIFNKLPHLPKKITAFFVFLAPWLTLIMLIFSLVVVPISLFLSVLSLFTLDLVIIASLFVSGLYIFSNTYLLLKAFKPLKKKELTGWVYLFWSQVLSVLYMSYEILTNQRGVILSVLSILIGFYILFEMRKFYAINNAKSYSMRSDFPINS